MTLFFASDNKAPKFWFNKYKFIVFLINIERKH
jgi:hypothetical protein